MCGHCCGVLLGVGLPLGQCAVTSSALLSAACTGVGRRLQAYGATRDSWRDFGHQNDLAPMDVRQRSRCKRSGPVGRPLSGGGSGRAWLSAAPIRISRSMSFSGWGDAGGRLGGIGLPHRSCNLRGRTLRLPYWLPRDGLAGNRHSRSGEIAGRWALLRVPAGR
jgi:hypothetical protein